MVGERGERVLKDRFLTVRQAKGWSRERCDPHSHLHDSVWMYYLIISIDTRRGMLPATMLSYLSLRSVNFKAEADRDGWRSESE